MAAASEPPSNTEIAGRWLDRGLIADPGPTPMALYQVMAEHKRYREALEQIVDLLGPDYEDCEACDSENCIVERVASLSAAVDALDPPHKPP